MLTQIENQSNILFFLRMTELDLDGFLETYHQSDGTDEKIEDLIKRWEDWRENITWGQKIIPLPFEEDEINFLNSRVLDGINHLAQMEYKWDGYAFCRLCSGDYFQTAKWFSHHFLDFHIENDNPFGHACVGGNLELVKWVYSFHIEIDPYLLDEGPMSKSIFTLALIEENFDICEWILTTFSMTRRQAEDSFEWTCYFGRLNASKWIYSHFPKLNPSHSRNWARKVACKYGHFDTLKWLHATFPQIRTVNINSEGHFRHACLGGHLEIVKWLYENYTVPLDMFPFICCCERGKMSVAMWMHKKMVEKGDINVDYAYACTRTSTSGQLEILQWLCQLYTLSDNQAEKCLKEALRSDHKEVAHWIYSEYPNITFEGKDKLIKDRIEDKCSLEMFQWLFPILQPKPSTDYFKLAINNQLDIEVIKWFYSLWPNLSYDLEKYWLEACRRRDFELVEWLSSLITVRQDQVDSVLSELLGSRLELVQCLFNLKK